MARQNHKTSRIETTITQATAHLSSAIALSEWNGAQWHSITFQMLQQESTAFSKKLQEAGVKPGDRIILISHNTVEAIIALFGIWLAEASAVLIDPDLPTEEIIEQITIADATCAVFSEENIACVNLITTLPYFIFKKNQWVLEKDANAILNNATLDFDPDIAVLIFTSGTTGNSKAVMLTHENFTYLMFVFQHYQLGGVGDVDLTILPLYHVAGLFCGIIQPLLLGSEVVMLRQLTADSIQIALQEKKPTTFILVPRLLDVFDQKILVAVSDRGIWAKFAFWGFTQINYFLSRYLRLSIGKKTFQAIHQQLGGRLKRILCGSAFLNSDIRKRFLTYGFDLFCAYGLSETCGPITFTKYDDQWRLRSVGPCVHKNDLMISPDGEILYRGPALMRGYFRDMFATNSAIIDGWFHTQDLGELDQHKNLKITGRKKELFVFSDGKKSTPEQIEKQYRQIDGIEDMAVFSVTVSDRLMTAIAFVPHQEIDAPALKEKILRKSSALSSPFCVHYVFSVENIPRSNTLKVKRYLLSERFQSKCQANENIGENESVIHSAEMEILLSCFYDCLPDKKQIISPRASFVELGIDSLLAAQLCAHIQKKMSIVLQPTTFWFHHNIEELHQYLLTKKKITFEKRSVSHFEPIAIVAMDCVLPGGAINNDVFWENLSTGKDGITDIPSSRWDANQYYDPYLLAPGKMNTKQGGFIELPNGFNPADFGVSERVLSSLDPQQLWLLLLTHRLLKQYAPIDAIKKWSGSNTGLFLGIGYPDFMLKFMKENPLTKIAPFTGIGISDFALAARVTFHYGFSGPSMVLNTACSSSLVAVHQALRALQARDCDYAIAGGINLLLIPEISVCLTKSGFLSPDGRCKVFDASANGYVRSEGCGLVLLKRYTDAENDGDRILGAIVGSAINQDGKRNGLTAPNGQAQMACYLAALESAQLHPHQINYIESHGTGTKLGDAIEMESIQTVYDRHRTSDNPLYIGALKSVIGHCEAASGIAGLIKTIHVLNQQIIPPNLHYHTQNPNIRLEKTAIILPTTCLPLTQKQHAAVSSFGIAGTNVHLILK